MARLRDSGAVPADPEEQSSLIQRLDAAIQSLSSAVTEDRDRQVTLQRERSEQLNVLQRSETQIMAIDEMLNRYRLLDLRYESDLNRLDFLSEGTHFFNALEDAQCPVCGQVMSVEHRDHPDGSANTSGVYEAARAEATRRNRTKVQRMEAEAHRLVLDGRAAELRLQVQPFSSAADQFITWARAVSTRHTRTPPSAWRRA